MEETAVSNKLRCLLNEYKKVAVVSLNMVGSAQLQRIKKHLRGTAEIIVGKNIIFRAVIQSEYPHLNALVPHIRDHVGLLCTNSDFNGILEILRSHLEFHYPKLARITPQDIFVHQGITILDPTKTRGLAALNIPTKISRGMIEFIGSPCVAEKGTVVGETLFRLLLSLQHKPIKSELHIVYVFDEDCDYPPSVLDYTLENLIGPAVVNILSLCAASGLEVNNAEKIQTESPENC